MPNSSYCTGLLSASASTSITSRRCAMPAADCIQTRCEPRISPSKAAPMASPRICAKTAVTSQTPISRVSRTNSTRPLNLEMAATEEMLTIALRHVPNACCLVPERREERTTEGGLDVIGSIKTLKPFVAKLQDAGIRVSLFIEPDLRDHRGGRKDRRRHRRAAYRADIAISPLTTMRQASPANSTRHAKAARAAGNRRPRSPCRPRSDLQHRYADCAPLRKSSNSTSVIS